MLNAWWMLAMISGAGLATRNLLFKNVNAKLDEPFAALEWTVFRVEGSELEKLAG